MGSSSDATIFQFGAFGRPSSRGERRKSGRRRTSRRKMSANKFVEFSQIRRQGGMGQPAPPARCSHESACPHIAAATGAFSPFWCAPTAHVLRSSELAAANKLLNRLVADLSLANRQLKHQVDKRT